MNEFLDILLDSFLDTIKLFPFLFLIYFLIELLEFKDVFKIGRSKLLTGPASPLLGSCLGIVPQCGFSVISAELLSQKKISISALIAVFLATSDEAIPILISNYKSFLVLLILLISKFIIALFVSYLVYFIYEKGILSRRQKKLNANIASQNNSKQDQLHDAHDHDHEGGDHADHDLHEHEGADEHGDDHDDSIVGEHHHKHLHACCNHDIDEHQKFDWKHPVVHSVKISIYIFVVNFLLSGIIALIGQDKLANFLTASYIFQPLFAFIIGLIPNCASSVILTELYMEGMISFGSILTGLCAGAGIGMVILFKENKNLKENLFIVAIISIASLLFGYAFHFLPINFV